MRLEQNLEQLFSRQEQAVVYLFSRYWEKISAFKSKNIRRIHTHFPDFAIVNAVGEEEAIEFEYELIKFRSHLKGDALRRLYHRGIRRLYIVYWEHNDEMDDLRTDIRKKARFDVVFVCLKDSFQAEVRPVIGMDGLQTFWRFTERKRTYPLKAYSLSDIVGDAKKLEPSVKYLDVDTKLYRVLGLNSGASEFIDYDHLEKIRFFTTMTRFARNRIPSRLLMKSTGCKYFNGYFTIKTAFEIVKASKSVKKFITDYYFDKWAQSIVEEKCFVGDFKRLEYEQGKYLYKFLVSNGYRLDIRGSIMIKETDINKIDAIIAR
jgi:hypothetical protein